MPPPRECPCTSGRLYRDCCGPFHRGEREAPDAEALMRSRFAAFALKDAAYLVRTLHSDHEDRQRSEAELLRELKVSAGSFRYMGLDILDQHPPDDDGIAEVLFLARVFQKGRDLSFVERSAFARDGEVIRYLRGEALPATRLSGDPRALTLATFPQRRSAG